MKKSNNDGNADFPREWKLISTENLYQGFNRIDKVEFTHALFSGGQSGVVDREQFDRGNVVGVLAHDPKLDKIALVEQFRLGARHKQEHPWLMEIIAGMVEPSEKPAEVAVRESYEEAGLTLSKVTQFKHYLASPGTSSEEVFLFYAETDLSEAGGIYGLDEENEDIRLHVVDANHAIELLDAGIICNALSIVAMQWFKISRLEKKR